MNKEFQNEFKNKRISHTHLFKKKNKKKNKRTEKEKEKEKEKWQKEKQQKMASPICWKKTTFFRYIKTGK